MTPEEQTVIQAAIEWYEQYVREGRRDPERLWDAVGDLLDLRQPPLWVARTWADVRSGDRTRLAGTEAVIVSAVRRDWHAKITDTGNGYWRTDPLEHSDIAARLQGRGDRLFSMRPGDPVEILFSPAEVAAIELLGWENRVGLEVASSPEVN